MNWIPAFFQHFSPLVASLWLCSSLFMILVVPALCRRFSLPAVVGLLVAGVVIGPHGLKIIPQNAAVAHFLAEMGKLMLMIQRLIDEPILNTVIVLMVVTSILGPVLTERFSRQIVRAGARQIRDRLLCNAFFSPLSP